jgi:retron-type reverse transcriptase
MTTRLASRLSDRTGIGVRDVERIIATAPFRYKVYPIEKRSGGVRIIAQPAREVKALQTSAVEELHGLLPVHHAAQAYVKNGGIRKNASIHVSNSYLLKLDFKNFFPSIHPEDFQTHLAKYAANVFLADEVSQLSRLLFWRPRGTESYRLSIGAPSSPFISNTLMYEIDAQLTDACAAEGIKYSRYADDLAFSSNVAHALDALADSVRSILRTAAYPRLRLNRQKTVFASRRGRRVITGVVLSSTGTVSLGRERKRTIRAMAHKQKIGQLSELDQLKLRGFLAFANDIEPAFAEGIRSKYLN